MKLKYYLRGVGIGIILTTLILIISNPKEKLSDKEIMERAVQLGMVMEEDNDKALEQVLSNLSSANKPSTVPDVEPSTKPTPMPTQEPTPEPTQEPTPEPTSTPTKAPVEEMPEDETEDTKEDISNQTINFTIEKGMTSNKVANLLEEVGLIDNATNFNSYIVSVGKASVIRVGEYSLTKDASYEEIIKAITEE